MTGFARPTRILTTAVTLLATLLTGDAAAQTLEPREAQCRVKIGEAARDYALFLTKRTGLCHRLRLRGRLGPGIDCDDISTWAANGFSRGVALQAKALNRLPKRVRTCNPITNLGDLGYGTCPAPCDSITINTLSDMTDCVQCKVEDCTLNAVDTIFGTPDMAMERPAKKCQERAGRYLTLYMKNRLYLQNVCQHGVELERRGFTPATNCLDINTATHPFFVRLAQIKAQQDNILTRRCSPIDVGGELDSCAADAAGLIGCVAAEVEACTDELWNMAFPVVP